MPDTESSQFTRANLAGLFFTLGFCLLTQPWDSLLYRPPTDSRSWTARLPFFIGRLNPIAGAAEAAIIITCLFDTAVDLLQRYRQGTSGGRLLFSDRADEFHVTAAALLLLRANGGCSWSYGAKS